jgi:hypothetical protein
MASLLPGLDVSRNPAPGASPKPLGILHRYHGTGFWCYTNIFVTSFFRNGLQQVVHWIHTGQLKRPDLIIAVPAWFSNLFVVMGCLWAYSRLPGKSIRDAGRLGIALLFSAGFFALDMALFQPRYLPLFRGALHPHLPRW